MKFCRNIMAMAVASTMTFWGCSSDSHVAGNSAETGSPELAGLLFLDNGNPATYALVQCVPQNYNAMVNAALPSTYSTQTDSQGYYNLNSIPEGIYNIEALHEESGKMFLAQNVNVSENDSTTIKDTLRSPGTIAVLLDDLTADDSPATATILGTTILRETTVRNHILYIENLPADTLDLRIYFENDTLDFKKISVLSNDTQYISSTPLLFTFTASLALPNDEDTLSSFISDFPLALRLPSDICDFKTLSNLTGRWEAVRISKDGNRSKKLPIANSYFDQDVKEAIFWVRVDSLNATDSLELRFDTSLEQAFAKDVFPTNRNYALVWHYDNGITIDDDAELTLFNGKASSTNVEAGVLDGVIGTYMQLESGGTIVAENSAIPDTTRKINLSFDNENNFCFSLWVQLESLSSEQTIFEKANEYALRFIPDQGFVVDFYHTATENIDDENAKDTVSYKHSFTSGTTGIEAKQWIYIAFSRKSNASSNYFINNTAIKTSGTRTNWDGIRKQTDFKVGGNFTGKLDELMIGSYFHDNSWTRLVYLNQKPTDYWPKLSLKK